jgi:hypothetical protein
VLLSYRLERLVARHLQSAIARGVAGIALVEFDGTPIAIAGMKDDELRPFVRFAVSRRPVAGGTYSFTLDDHVVAVATADSLCLVGVLNAPSRVQFALVYELCDEIVRLIGKRDPVVSPPPRRSNGSSGSGSEPADLELVEYGITVRRDHGES